MLRFISLPAFSHASQKLLGNMGRSEGRWSNLQWLVLALREMNRGPEVDLGPTLLAQAQWRYDANITRASSRPPSDGISGVMPGEPISGEFFDPGAAPINVLCMDGGGIRGRCLLAMVEEMEAVLGAPIAEHFDLIAGTSIGGCGSLFLSRYPEWGHATRMARKALQELQSRCFAAKQRNWGRLFSRGFLCADARQDFMLELCGPSQPLVTSGPRAFAVSARKRRRGGGLEPFLFRTYDLSEEEAANSHAGTSRVALWQAIEATSAAPFLFPRARLEIECDGDHEDDDDEPRISEVPHAQAEQQQQQQQQHQQHQQHQQSGPTTPVADLEQQGGGGGRAPPASTRLEAERPGAAGTRSAIASSSASTTSASTASTIKSTPRERRKIEVWLADGGLVANDPTAIALREARALWPNRPIGTVVSLGTGSASPLGADERSIDPSRSRIGRAVRAVGGPRARYYRLNPTVKGVSMIDSDEDKLQAMEAGARAFFRGSSIAREACVRLAEAASNRADYRRVETFRRNWPVTATVQRTSQGLLGWLLSCLFYLLSRVLVRLAEARHNVLLAVAARIWRMRGLPPARQHQLRAQAEARRSMAMSDVVTSAPQGFTWPSFGLLSKRVAKSPSSATGPIGGGGGSSRPMHTSA